MKGRIPKLQVMAELTARSIEFDENAKYGVLWKLLKKPVPATDEDLMPAENKTFKNLPVFPAELYERAKKIGMSEEMIATYPDMVSLKRACDGISPRTNPDARPEQGKVPEPKKHEEKMPDKFEFESRLECKFMMANRAQFDENNLQTELRKINRKYGRQEPVKIVQTKTFKPIKGYNEETKLSAKFLVTRYEIFFKKG